MFEIRPATLQDVDWLRSLAVESAIYGVPEGRDTPNEAVRQSVAEFVKDVDKVLGLTDIMAVLVAHDGDRPVGYLILEFDKLEPSTGDRQTCLVDMAVEKDYWGTNVSALLVRYAARLTAKRGFRYMTALVTASNRRSLLKAQRLGFEIERHALVMACGPDGPVPMPGRPEHERGHAVSRKRSK